MTTCKLTPSDAVVKRDALVRGDNVENDGSHDVKTFIKSPEIRGQIKINIQSQDGFACPFLSPNEGGRDRNVVKMLKQWHMCMLCLFVSNFMCPTAAALWGLPRVKENLDHFCFLHNSLILRRRKMIFETVKENT